MSPQYTNTVLVTGASRGIGRELAAQYLTDGWKVIATCRNPENSVALGEMRDNHPTSLRTFRLDLTDEKRMKDLGCYLKNENIDLLLNNAGTATKQRTLSDVSYESWEECMRVNAYATLKMAHVFLEQVARSRKKTILTISSQMGSIMQNTEGMCYAYRASKAAANMIVKTLSVDLADRGIVVNSVHPGWVKTDLGGQKAPLSVEKSAHGIRALVERLKLQDSGRFFSWDGSEIPW